MRLPTPFAPFVLCAAILSIAGGCEDSQARKRAEVQQVIQQATEQLRAAAAVRVDVDQQDKLRRDLNALITTLSGTTDGEPGQRAAASRLAGTAHRTLASIDLVHAERLEADNRSRRSDVGNLVDAALELNALASVLETVDTSEQQQMLAEDREGADEQLREHGEHMATLDGPIADIRRRNRDDRAKADSLREEAGALRREAADLGPGDGYTVFEESLFLDRQADQIEYEIARRELELRFILEPEHTLAETRSDQAQTRGETADRARQSLEAAADSLAGEADATRERIAEIGAQIETAMAEIEQSSASSLADLYERAASNLNRAATKAKSAATLDRGDGKDAARIEAARAYQQLGDMYWSRAEGMEQDITLRQRLVADRDVLGVGAGGWSIADLAAAHEETVAAAVEAYTNAQSLLGQVAGRSARRRLEAVKLKMDALEAAASGQAVDVASLEPDVPPQAASTSSGAESPEEIVEAFRNATGLRDITDLAYDLTYVDFQTQSHRMLFDASMAANRAVLALDEAVQAKFGTGMMDQLGAMGGNQDMMGFSPEELAAAQFEIGEVSGSHGTMQITSDGDTEDVKLIRINGRWYVDGTEEFRMLTDQMAAAGGEETAVLMMIQSLSGVMEDLTERVQADEFGSVQDVMTAFGQAVMEAQSP
jgi:hypothetical protein